MDSSYTVFQQYLSLYNGTITTRYDNNRTITFFGAPNSEILGIHVEDQRTTVKSVTFQISMWDPATQITSRGSWQSMQADVPDITTWKTVTSFANQNAAGISRGQADPNHFGYTLAATVDGAAFTSTQKSNLTVELQITPSSSYTIWIACASRLNAPGYNLIARAASLLDSIKSAGYTPTLTAFTDWWHAYWEKSFVQYSNTAGDADLDIHWSGAYWYWNQRDVYNSFLASNHPDVLSGLYRSYSRNLPALGAFTQTSFGISGAWTPETMRWDGNANHTTESSWTNKIYSTGAEVASNMYSRFAYTRDSTFLRDTAYPFMRETAKFMAAKLSYDAGSKQYYMALSNAHETYWNVKNAINELAAVRSFLLIGNLIFRERVGE